MYRVFMFKLRLETGGPSPAWPPCMGQEHTYLSMEEALQAAADGVGRFDLIKIFRGDEQQPLLKYLDGFWYDEHDRRIPAPAPVTT